MSKYDLLINKLIELTSDKKIEWNVVSNSKYEDEIFQSHYSWRVMESVYEDRKQIYDVVVVEKKIPNYEASIEEYHVEVIFMKKRAIIFTITSDIVRNALLEELAKMATKNSHEHNDLLSGIGD